ncbi:SMC family ATPase [Candidatus Dependentiae bacterium]|nr:SMC family ATPase [Candidatus Dependentiae bacterium]
MIPRRIELKNFLSYGEPMQVVDFVNYSLMCLSGKNGHGKSALLDALTWAVWGQARKTGGTSKADEGLLRLGQTRMMVCLEFEFNQNVYRIRREYAKTYGKPYAALDFEIFDQEKQRFISLTDKTIRQTQAKIEQLIGLDFETFTNSAFIRQGQSNEFSKKSSKERKQILANILGLSRYDTLQSKALESAKQLGDEKKLISMMQEQHNTALAQRQEIMANSLSKKEMLQQSVLLVEQHQQNVLNLEKERMQLEHAQVQLNQLTSTYDTIKKTYNLKLQVFIQLIKSWKSTHAQLLTYANIHDLENRKKILHQQEKSLLEVHQKSLTLHEKSLTIKDIYQKRYALLKTEADKQMYELTLNIDRQAMDLKHQSKQYEEKQHRYATLTKQIEVLKQEQALLNEQQKNRALFEVKFEADKLQFEKRRAYYPILVQRGNWMSNELVELEHRKKVVHDQTNPSCPLCEQVLTLKRKQFLSTRFTDQEHFLTHRFTRISNLIKRLKEILVKQHQELDTSTKQQVIFTKNAARQDEIAQQLTMLTHEQEAADKALYELSAHITQTEQAHLQAQQARISQEQLIGATLEKDTELTSLRTTLAELTSQRTALSYNPEEFSQLQEHIKQLEMLLAASQQVTQLHNEQHERKTKIASIIPELKQFKLHITQIEHQLAELASLNEQEQKLGTKLTEEKLAQANAASCKEALLKEIAGLDHELQRLDGIAQQFEANRQKLAHLDQEIEDYTNLAQAFGKNGIQALLIEDAIPEIEKEANDILSRLTNNQSQIFIESLRDLKSGGVKETLDIQISDTAGIRPYEMFSGGEAFRIDFSLRIAISKLLARRAGTALQTLIIDEGFGSQDEDGLTNIMQALYTVQHDFSKIIIVSHLAEFKENFPVHLIVEKGPNGSVVHVEERG